MRAFGRRYRHTIISLNGNIDMAAQMPAGAPVQYCDCRPGSGVGRFRRIRGFIAAAKPDVLVTYNWGAIEWAMANRFFAMVRHVHIEDGFGPEERNRQLMRRVLFRRLALGGLHTIVVLPSLTLVKIATEQWRLRRDSLRHIVNGIDCDRFAVSRTAPTPGAPVVVGTVASLRREKNLGRLIGAFAVARQNTHADMHLIIVGNGPERDALEETARAAGCAEHVLFAGASETPEDYFAQMDIFAMSSDTEQMPLGVLEAMATGLPVVATDVGDIANMVAPLGRPFVTGLNDGDDLSRCLMALADNALLRQELGGLNREKALAEFDYRQMAVKYAELFD